MINEIFIHEAQREYVYPISRSCVELKLVSTTSGNVTCRLVYWDRHKEEKRTAKKADAECFARDGKFTYYRCRIIEADAVKYIRYYFEINTGKEKTYLTVRGLKDEEPAEGFFEYLYTNLNDIYNVPEWMKGAVVYQIFPERFCSGDDTNDPEGVQPWNTRPTRENFFGGDIRGIISKLDYLSELGVNAIYLNPIFKAPSNHKYDTVDYYQIDSSFGNMELFKELVAKCHERGIRVILDGVFNHCGYHFAMFQDVLKNGEDSCYKHWFYIESYPVRTDPPNYECVGYYKWMPKLRFSNPDVRRYFLDVGAYWVEKTDIDGWRLDVSDEVDFTFWQQFRRRIKSIKKDTVLIGETWKDGRDMLRGDQMDSIMNYLFRDAVVDFIAKDAIDVHEFDNRIQKMYAMYASPIVPALYNLIGSHDTDRFLTLCKGDKEKLKLAVAFQMTFPGMPAVYYGDEIGMDGETDPDCRRPMQWDDIDKALCSFCKQLIRIRKTESCLVDGSFETVACDAGMYAFARRTDKESVYVVLNNSGEERVCSIPIFETSDCIAYNLLNNKPYTYVPIDNGGTYFNQDINEYSGMIELTVSGYSLEIIKIKERG